MKSCSSKSQCESGIVFHFIEAVKADGFDAAGGMCELSIRDKRTLRRKLQDLASKVWLRFEKPSDKSSD